MALPSSTPPLLLTKRLTAFLHANQTPTLPTLLLTTPNGKLLAHASPHPVTTLRTHASVAASLLQIHTASSASLPSALPGARTPDPIGSSPPEEDLERAAAASAQYADGESTESKTASTTRTRLTKPVTITVQLSGGTVIIRRLKCGLLFVCIGPAAGDPDHLHSDHHHDASRVGSPSEVDSMISMGGQSTASLDSVGTAAVVAMRRHAADLARWLDDKLGTLTVPEEGVGVE